MATLPLDSAQARAATEAAELQSQKLSLEGLRKNLQTGPEMDKKLKRACEGFESIFLNKLWAEMRKTVPKEGYLHSKEEDAYLSMFDQELMKKMSEAGGIGLGKMLYENLSDHLAKASAGTAARIAKRSEVKPLHSETKGMALHPGNAPIALGSEARLHLKAADAARLEAQKVEEAAAAASSADPAPTAAAAAAADPAASGIPVVLPPGFRGPDPVPAQDAADLAALDQAMDLARRVEGSGAAHRAARAYRHAAGAPGRPASAPVAAPAEEPAHDGSGS